MDCNSLAVSVNPSLATYFHRNYSLSTDELNRADVDEGCLV